MCSETSNSARTRHDTRSRAANFHLAAAANTKRTKPSQTNVLSWISNSNLHISIPANERLEEHGDKKPAMPCYSMTYKKEAPKKPFGRIKSHSLIQKEFVCERSPTNSEQFKLSSVSGGKDYSPGKRSEQNHTKMSFGPEISGKNIGLLKQNVLSSSTKKKNENFSMNRIMSAKEQNPISKFSHLFTRKSTIDPWNPKEIGTHMKTSKKFIEPAQREEEEIKETSEKRKSILLTQKMREGLQKRVQTVSGQGSMTDLLGSRKLEDFPHSEEPSSTQKKKVLNSLPKSSKDNVRLLKGVNSVLRSWRDTFPNLFEAMFNLMIDPSTGISELETFKGNLKNSFNISNSKIEQFMPCDSEDLERKQTMMLTENVFLLESIQELFETGVSKLQTKIEQERKVQKMFASK
jgi:hypothetical protein